MRRTAGRARPTDDGLTAVERSKRWIDGHGTEQEEDGNEGKRTTSTDNSRIGPFARSGQDGLANGPGQCPPDSCFTRSPTACFASPNSMYVWSAEYSSLSMPAKPGFMERLMAMHIFALSASMIGMP